MRWSRLLLLGLFVGVLLATGCGINEKETITVNAGDAFQSWGIKATRAQTLTISVSANPAPVDVYIVLESDKEAAKQALEANKAPTAKLAGKTKVTEDNFENLAVPANTLVTVFLVPTGAKTEVKLKATSK